jgi:hypothetical protein
VRLATLRQSRWRSRDRAASAIPGMMRLWSRRLLVQD